jgi:hypothetical protein
VYHLEDKNVEEAEEVDFKFRSGLVCVVKVLNYFDLANPDNLETPTTFILPSSALVAPL